MALQTQGFLLGLTLVDNGGNKSRQTFNLVAADFATAATLTATILTSLNAITDALVLNYSLGEVFEEDTALFGGGEIENVASISAKIDDPSVKYATVRIPAPVDGLFQAASGPLYNQIDPADTDLVTHLNHYQSDVELSDGEHLDSPGSAGNVTGKRIHRASRKG